MCNTLYLSLVSLVRGTLRVNIKRETGKKIMFKLYKSINREAFAERREATTGHDRFCKPKIQLPRYRRRKNASRRTQEETDFAFELTVNGGSSRGFGLRSGGGGGGSLSGSGGTYSCGDSSAYSSTFNMCPSVMSEIQWPSPQFNQSMTSIQQLHEEFQLPASFTCPPEPDHSMFLQDNCSDHVHQYPSRGYQQDRSESRDNSGWSGSISKFLSTVATTLTCRKSRKYNNNNHQIPRYDPTENPNPNLRPVNYDYNRLGDDSVAAEMVEMPSRVGAAEQLKLKTFPPHYGLIRSEKTAGHTACMNYLKNSNGRYVLLEQLPEIGWRTNRLWYVICDARVNAKRLLIATPCNSRSPIVDSTTKNIMTQICRALQHPYICPVLDLETVTVENFDRPFTLVVMPLGSRGSLRDVIFQSQWADHFPNKYCKRGAGLSAGNAQRFSCHILEALLELRMRGLPAGIGAHLHCGNVLIQHGTARFSGLDNVLMSNNPRALPFISRYINSDLEAIDSIAFAYLLFSMCTGYEVTTAKLSPQNWTDVRDYVQVSQVLEFILENPENRIPTLREISNLDFYRTLDLRELKSRPLPQIMAGSPLPSVKVLLEHLRSNRFQKGKKKSRSTSSVFCAEKAGAAGATGTSSTNPFTTGPLYESPSGLQPRSFSSSTPSISKAQNLTTSDSLVFPKDGNCGVKPDPDSVAAAMPEGSVSGSSLVSVYCTPTNSLSESLKNQATASTSTEPRTSHT